MSHNSCLILHRSASTNPTMRMSDGPRPVRKRHNHGRSLRETASKPPQQQPPKPPQPQQLPSPSLSAETAIPSFIHDDTICPVQNPVKADNQSSTHSDYSSHGSDSSSQSHEDSTKQQLTLATENAPLHQSMDVYLDHIEDDQDEIVRMTRRNKDILLARLHEVVPNGKLAVVSRALFIIFDLNFPSPYPLTFDLSYLLCDPTDKPLTKRIGSGRCISVKRGNRAEPTIICVTVVLQRIG